MKIGKTGNSVYNDDIRIFLSHHVRSFFENPMYSEMDQTGHFLDLFPKWITSSQFNKIEGLESFPVRDVSLGVTQALDQFHYDVLLQNRRLRVFKGEYPYSRDVHPFNYSQGYLDDYELTARDAVVISCPFSATGALHPRQNEILDTALTLGVPVLLDLAWFGTCAGIEIDLSHPGISAVAFSLTKGLTCGNYRSGIRFTRSTQETCTIDRLRLQTQWNHGIHLNTFVGYKLMQNFTPDTQYLKYSALQREICEALGVEASPCVHIATSNDTKWDDYTRDGVVNRLNLREEIKFRHRRLQNSLS